MLQQYFKRNLPRGTPTFIAQDYNLKGKNGGLDIVVDPYTNSTSGTVRVVALQSVDVAVRHAVSFAFGNDG